MAERRMMAKSIIKSDLFLDMPATTQNLYFHMLLEADDDGFINSPKSIMRVIGAKDDDIKVLIAKQFVIPFESGVLVIKHWKIHNYIQKDRYRPSLRPEKEMLSVAESKEYVEVLGDVSSMDTRCIQNVRVGKVSIGKSRLGKSSIGKNTYSPSLPSVAEDIVTFLNSTVGSNYKSTTDKTRKLIAARLAEGFTVDDFKAVITKKAKEWQGTDMAQYLRPETLFGTKFEGYLNQPERNNRRSPISRAEQERQEAINVVNELIAEYEEEERQNGQSKHDESNSTASISF